MQLDELRSFSFIFKVKTRRFPHIIAELLPCLGFSENGMPQRSRNIAALFCLAHFEYQFHASSITEK